jgi:hypothetical protein
MTQTVTALFDRHEDAAAAVRNLEIVGIPDADISMVANNTESWYKADQPSNAAGDAGDAGDAGAGAGIGAVAGGGVGLLTGLGIMAIPGVGPVVAAGWLVATAAGTVLGAAAGGAAGGIVGALTNSGVSETHAHVYAEGVRRGGTPVTARVADDRVAEANGILDRSRQVNLDARGDAYRQTGWSRFDTDAPVYTDEQVSRERDLYR